MTEREAIREIRRLCCNESQFNHVGVRKCKDNCMYGKDRCPFEMAITALEEIQEYRKLGTVAEVKQAVEKTKAKKPDLEGDGYADGNLVYDTWICPNCGERYEVDYDDYQHCPKCGQKIDRSEEFQEVETVEEITRLEKILQEIDKAEIQEDAPIYHGDVEVDGYIKADIVREIIKKHLSECNDGWIPTDERMPDSDGYYLATLNGEIVGQKEPFVGLAKFKDRKWIGNDDNCKWVLYWRPFPKPYKESE